MNYRQQLGNKAEQLVAYELQTQGYTILEHNFRKKTGEIDLIAMHGDFLVFVEVKMRQDDYFDLGDVVTASKQKKIILVAKTYIALHGYEEKVGRFDVALVQGIEDGKQKLSYIENAFNEGDYPW